MKKNAQSAKIAAILEALDNELEPILKALIDQAKSGNVQAAKLVLEYRATLQKIEAAKAWPGI